MIIEAYLDSCIYISVAKKEKNIPEDYWSIVKHLIKSGDLKIFTSKFVEDEVKSDKTQGDLAEIQQLLDNSDAVISFEVEGLKQKIHKVARAMVALAEQCNEDKDGTKLHIEDAYHLQVAIMAGADEFHTTDKQLLGLSKKVLGDSKLKIVHPKDSAIYLAAKSTKHSVIEANPTGVSEPEATYGSYNDYDKPAAPPMDPDAIYKHIFSNQTLGSIYPPPNR